MQSASRPAACIPAATLYRLRSYSARAIAGMVFTTGFAVLRLRSVGGKLPHRLRNLLRAGHEELLLGGVERHRRYIRGCDACHGPVEVVESVLGVDRDGPVTRVADPDIPAMP